MEFAIVTIILMYLILELFLRLYTFYKRKHKLNMLKGMEVRQADYRRQRAFADTVPMTIDITYAEYIPTGQDDVIEKIFRDAGIFFPDSTIETTRN